MGFVWNLLIVVLSNLWDFSDFLSSIPLRRKDAKVYIYPWLSMYCSIARSGDMAVKSNIQIC